MAHYTTLTITDPHQFLRDINSIDPIAALRVANVWAGGDSNAYLCGAAWEFTRGQTVYPECQKCKWPVLPDDPHVHCDEQLRELALDDDDYGCDDENTDDYYDDDEPVSTSTVYSRALAHFGGNRELAHEAATQYPGDFI